MSKVDSLVPVTPQSEVKTTTIDHTGKVVGHRLRFIPGYTKKRRSKVTVSRPPILGASVHLLVDGRHYTVRSVHAERELEVGILPTDADRTLVYKVLLETHPINATRTFKEVIKPSNRDINSPYIEYFLDEK